MRFAFGNRQTVIVRAYAACQNMVAVDDQVMSGDGRRQIAACIGANIVYRIGGCDMFHDHAKLRYAFAKRVKHPLDEHGFAIKNVDVRIGDFAVHAQGQADLRHALQYALHIVEIADPGL